MDNALADLMKALDDEARAKGLKVIVEHCNETFYIDPDTGAVVRGTYIVDRTEIPPSD